MTATENAEYLRKLWYEGVELIDNHYFIYEKSEYVIHDAQKKAKYLHNKQNKMLKRNEDMEPVVIREVFDTELNELRRVGIRANRNFTVEQYLKFIIGSELLYMNKQQLKIYTRF